MNSKLPRSRLVHDGADLRCPWCDADAEGVTLTLGAIFTAHAHDALEGYPPAKPGVADPFSLVADCDACARPFAVVLHDKWFGELHPVRTAADLKLIGGGE